MKENKKAKLLDAGWRLDGAADFLGLSREERTYIETRLSLAGLLRRRRRESGLTQAQLAGRLGSSQSRIAKMEACEASVSLDLMVKALIALGVNREDLARAIVMVA